METNSKPHRKSRILSLADRVEVIREYDRHSSGPSVRSLARKFECSPVQIQKILLNRKSILKSYKSINGDPLNETSNLDDLEKKRQEKIAFLDRVIYEYIQRALYSNSTINDDKIKLKAFQIKECIALDNFHPTNVWLDNIRETYGIAEFDLESLRNSVVITEEKSSNMTAIDMVEYVRRKEQEAQEEQTRKNTNNSKDFIDDNKIENAKEDNGLLELISSDLPAKSAAKHKSCKSSQSKECTVDIKANSLKRKMTGDQKKDEKFQKFDLTELPDQLLTESNSFSTSQSIDHTAVINANSHLNVTNNQDSLEPNTIFENGEQEDDEEANELNLPESPTKLQTQHISSSTSQPIKCADHINDSKISKITNITKDKFHSITDRASAINMYANGTRIADLSKIFDVSATTIRNNLLYSNVIMQVYNKYYSSDNNIQEKMSYDKFIKEISTTYKNSNKLQYPIVSNGKDSNIKFAQMYNVSEINMQRILANNKHVMQNYNSRCNSKLNMNSAKSSVTQTNLKITLNQTESKEDFITVPKKINCYDHVLEALKPVEEFAEQIGNFEGLGFISALEEHIKNNTMK